MEGSLLHHIFRKVSHSSTYVARRDCRRVDRPVDAMDATMSNRIFESRV